jgi:two-component system sensor histidine kinase KdpD
MSSRTSLLVLRDRPPSRLLGVLCAAAAVALTTALIFAIKQVAPAVSTGVVYLIAVLLISTYWGAWLGVLTAIGSALAFNWFHIPPTGRFTIAEAENWVALAVFLAAAGIASTVAQVARNRAEEAELRLREADLAAEMARLLLGGASLPDALAAVGRRLAQALDLASASVELAPVASDARHIGIPLDLGRGRTGALLVPAAIEPEALERVRERIAPSLEALLAAALDREALQAEVVETQALRRSDVIKTALLRAVSHDLRSPLTAIVTAGAALRSGGLDPAEREELAAVVTGEASRLARLVDKLLDLSRLQGGTAEPRADWCSIEEVVEAAVAELEGQDGPPVRLALDRDLPLVRADAAQLERAFFNLLENARRYSGDAPVQVRARVSGGRLLVRVVDRGPGIPPERLERIFQPFYRDDDGGGHPGSGLGLAIVRGFVEANGGRVWAESLPGQGTAFVVELPLPAQAEEPAEGVPAGAGSS